jgi:WD40 repeat protein
VNLATNIAVNFPAAVTAAANALLDATAPAIERLLSFLTRALPLAEYSLSQNETLNIFADGLLSLLSAKPAASAGGGDSSAASAAANGAGTAAGTMAGSTTAAGAEDDVDALVMVGDAASRELKEERLFMDLELTNNRTLPCVEWHPRSPSWLAVASVPRLSLEQRVAESILSRSAPILLYALNEFTNQFVLEAPADVTCMHWNPANPSFIAVGCITGQVAVFDMSQAHEKLAAKKRAGRKGAAKADPNDPGRPASRSAKLGGVTQEILVIEDEEEDDDALASRKAKGGASGSSTHRAVRVQPKAVSAVDSSHSRPVVGVRWFPAVCHLNGRGVFGQSPDNEVAQFLSAGADGTLALWDVRTKDRDRERARTKLAAAPSTSSSQLAISAGAKAAAAAADAAAGGPELLQSNLVPGAAAAGVAAPLPDIPWNPLYRINIRHGQGAISVSSFLMNDRRPTDPVLLGTETGALVAVDWAPAGEGTGQDDWLGPNGGNKDEAAPPSGGKSSNNSDKDDGSLMRVLWTSAAPDRPPVSLQRSPFFSDIFLAASDFQFTLWRRGTKQPLFVSPAPASAYTTGRWSPSRAGVIFLGRQDGAVEIWDFLDTTNKPVMVFPLISVPVSVLEFRLFSGATNMASTMQSMGTMNQSSLTGGAGGGAAGKQLLAVGDAKGSLHILDVPLPLRKGMSNEEALVAGLFDREASRTLYTAARYAHHESEKVKRDAEEARLVSLKEADNAKLEAELAQAQATLANEAAAAGTIPKALDMTVFVAQRKAEERAAAERAYRALESQIMKELGISDADLRALDDLEESKERERERGRRRSPSPSSPSRFGNNSNSSAEGKVGFAPNGTAATDQHLLLQDASGTGPAMASKTAGSSKDAFAASSTAAGASKRGTSKGPATGAGSTGRSHAAAGSGSSVPLKTAASAILKSTGGASSTARGKASASPTKRAR